FPARLVSCLPAWQDITEIEFVLSIIEFGLGLEVRHVLGKRPFQNVDDGETMMKMDEAVAEMSEAHVTRVVADDEDREDAVFSPLIPVAKKDVTKIRPAST